MDPMPEEMTYTESSHLILKTQNSLHMNDAEQSLASLFILTSVEFLTLGENLWR